MRKNSLNQQQRMMAWIVILVFLLIGQLAGTLITNRIENALGSIPIFLVILGTWFVYQRGPYRRLRLLWYSLAPAAVAVAMTALWVAAGKTNVISTQVRLTSELFGLTLTLVIVWGIVLPVLKDHVPLRAIKDTHKDPFDRFKDYCLSHSDRITEGEKTLLSLITRWETSKREIDEGYHELISDIERKRKPSSKDMASSEKLYSTSFKKFQEQELKPL